MRIGVFDSGLGGINVLKALIKYHPNQEYIYVGDNKNLPYGEKSKIELLNLSSKIIDFLVSEQVDLILIACGTVSSNVYNELKQKYNIPIFNIIDTTISKIKESNIKNLAVLATPATINTHIFKNKLKNINVTEISCGAFVSLVENTMDKKYTQLYIKEYLKEIKKEGIKDIVLGCTHYPLLEEDIRKYLGDVNFYNMGRIVANSIYLKEGNSSLNVYFTNNNMEINNKVNNILEQKIKTKQIDL